MCSPVTDEGDGVTRERRPAA